MNDKRKGPWGQHPSGDQERKESGRPEEIDKLVQRSQDKIRQLFPGGGGGNHGGSDRLPFGGKVVAAGAALVLLILWLMTGFYTVDTKEEAVVLRFGKYVRTDMPGLRYHLPVPIERVVKLRVTDRYVDVIGRDVSQAGYSRPNRAKELADDQPGLLMLTGDENIADISFEVQWQISDARKYLFNVSDPRSTVVSAAESAMREVIATTSINDILSEDRITTQQQTKVLLQSILDSYDAGVVIKEINLKAVPPHSSIDVEVYPTATELSQGKDIVPQRITTTVADAFKDVQAAINNKEEKINIAKGYANQQIPIARGEAEQTILDAEAYKAEVVAQANGEAARFTSVYNEYKKAKNVTRKRIYLETLESILANIDKVIIDRSVGKNVLPYLPLGQSNIK